jgi:hypothetical protein
VSNRQYPKGVIDTAIQALELSYSYLREKPAIGEAISDVLDRLYRYRQLETGEEHPYRRTHPDAGVGGFQRQNQGET